MIKTAIENGQNLIVEGCYIPLDWARYFGYFDKEYRDSIRLICLVMSERYICTYFTDIQKYASVIERRMDDGDCTMENILSDHRRVLEQCQRHHAEYVLINEQYAVNIDL